MLPPPPPAPGLAAVFPELFGEEAAAAERERFDAALARYDKMLRLGYRGAIIGCLASPLLVLAVAWIIDWLGRGG